MSGLFCSKTSFFRNKDVTQELSQKLFPLRKQTNEQGKPFPKKISAQLTATIYNAIKLNFSFHLSLLWEVEKRRKKGDSFVEAWNVLSLFIFLKDKKQIITDVRRGNFLEHYDKSVCCVVKRMLSFNMINVVEPLKAGHKERRETSRYFHAFSYLFTFQT